MHTSSVSQYRVACAVLKCGNLGWVWVVACCPCCGGEHWHSGGPLHGDPYRFVGPETPYVCPAADLLAGELAQASATRRPLIYVLQPDHTISIERVRG